MERLEKIKNLQADIADLHIKLGKSLALQELFKRRGYVIDLPVSCQVTGNIRHISSMTFTVRKDGGALVSFPLEAVPRILWPDAVVNDLKRHGYVDKIS